jgi:hypothetical protein
MKPFNSRVDGLSYEAILNALAAKAKAARDVAAGQSWAFPEHRTMAEADRDPTTLHLGGDLTRSVRNRARFIAERALELPHEDRYDFVNRKIWE